MLINCPECGNSVSDKASKCPECGHPIRSMLIKRKIKHFLIKIKHFAEKAIKKIVDIYDKNQYIQRLVYIVVMFAICLAVSLFVYFLTSLFFEKPIYGKFHFLRLRNR